MSYTVLYRDKYNAFNFTPFIDSMTEAKKLYIKYVWWGYKAVRIDSDSLTVWETPDPVIHPIDNPHPTEDLPF